MDGKKLLNKLNELYKEMDSNKSPLSILIDGKWGIGKTYVYKQFSKSKKKNNYYMSLFGINSIEEVKKTIIKEVLFPDLKKLNSNNTLNILGSCFNRATKSIPRVGKALSDIANIIPNINELTKVVNIEDLKFSEKSILCIDDIERTNEKIDFKELMGLFERLSNKTNIIIIGNIEELDENKRKIYDKYKEKVIDFEYKIDSLSDDVIQNTLKDYNWTNEIKETLITIFKEFGKDNLRTFRLLNNFLIDLKMEYSWNEFSEKEENYIIEASYYALIENLFGVFKEKHKNEIHTGEEKTIEPFDYLMFIPIHLSSLVMDLDIYYKNRTKIDSIKRKFKEVKNIINYMELLSRIDYSFTLNDEKLIELKIEIEKILDTNEDIPFYEFTIFFFYYYEISINFNHDIDEKIIDKLKEKLREEIKNTENKPSINQLISIYARDDRNNESIKKIKEIIEEVWNEQVDTSNILLNKNIKDIDLIIKRNIKLPLNEEYKEYISNFIKNGIESNELRFFERFIEIINVDDMKRFKEKIDYNPTHKWQVKRYDYVFCISELSI